MPSYQPSFFTCVNTYYTEHLNARAWETIKFAEKISPDEVAFYNIATHLPGTLMYDLVKKNGWLRVTDFDKYDCATPIFETPMLSMKELGELYG
jgi:radical SAM superfamily enzyme YgiQ (UPF0313 family)